MRRLIWPTLWAAAIVYTATHLYETGATIVHIVTIVC